MSATLLGLRTVAGEPIDTLVIPGYRRNPKRAHLWVSTVLGKHIPADPDQVIAAAQRLGDRVAEALQPPENDLAPAPKDAVPQVFGFAETATGLGHAVAHRLAQRYGDGLPERSGVDYLQSTRRPGAPVAMTFQEGHSHATDHLICPAGSFGPPAGPLVLVDDEISTGATALDAIAAFAAWSGRRRYVVAALVDFRSPAAQEQCAAVAEHRGVQVDWVSLAHAHADIPDGFTDYVAALPAAEPAVAVATPGADYGTLRLDWPAATPDGGRYGFRASDYPAFDAGAATIAARIDDALGDPTREAIIIGHEELMYLPTRVAQLVRRRSWVQTTTRSPAYVSDAAGYPLRCGFEFAAAEPDAAAPRRYLYNAAVPGHDPAIVLVADKPADTPAWHGPQGVAAQLRDAGRDVLSVFISGPTFDDIRASRLTDDDSSGHPAAAERQIP